MEYCGGGSVADLMHLSDEPLEEAQIAYICRESLKVGQRFPSLDASFFSIIRIVKVHL